MRHFLVIALCLFLVTPAGAQNTQKLPLAIEFNVPGVTYNSDIPTPEDIIGHEIGTYHTRPHQVVEYFKAIANQSDRVIYEEHARSFENRPLIHAYISTPENLARLEEIRLANLKLSDDPNSVSDADLENMPGILYMGYSVHGNEASGTEAAVLLLYHLSAGEGSAVQSVLENNIIILDPMFNPDGRDRFTDWVNGNRGAVATIDGQDREHNELWPSGRTNHYWFDLNRDWMPVQLPESQGRIKLFHHWRPQIVTDYHEMGGNASYFFQPGIQSRTNPNTETRNQDLTRQLAGYHAKWLDGIGSLYYSEESFDDFYYGKGSTFPDVNGSIGILFEQASSRALVTQTTDGVMNYAFTIRNHFAASISTLEGAVDMRIDLLKNQRDFYKDVPDHVKNYPVKGWVVSLAGDRTRTQAFAQMLQRHRIKINALDKDITVNGNQYAADEAFIISTDQQQMRFLKAMMEKVTTFEDSLFYDVSAWTMPLAFGLDYDEITRMPRGAVGAELPAVEFDGGELIGGRSEYAYLMEWGRYFSPRALYRLQAAGLRPRLMMDDFSLPVEGELHQFSAGTIMIPVVMRGNTQRFTPAAMHAMIKDIVAEDHVKIYAVQTGFSPAGIDLGSPDAVVLKKPRVAILTGGGAAYDAGETWHLLSERMKMPVSLLDQDEVAGADLSKYTAIIMVRHGFYDLGSSGTKALEDWMRDGGNLIAMSNGVNWLINNEIIDAELVEAEDDSSDIAFADIGRTFGAQVIGGAIFEVKLDVTHPLAYGYGATMPVFRFHTTFVAPAGGPGINVATYTDSPRLSGYISDRNLKALAGSSAIQVHSVGRGKAIFMTDNTNFRAFWYGTNGLLMNALFFGQKF